MRSGYQPIAIYEIWTFSDSSTTIFTELINILAKEKLKASGFPGGVDTDDQKADFVANLNKAYNFDPPIHPAEVVKATAKRSLMKLMSNCIWGRISAESKTSVEIISKYEKLVELFTDETRVVSDLIELTPDSLMACYSSQEEFRVLDPSTSLLTGLFVTAGARVYLYEHGMQMLDEAQICYCGRLFCKLDLFLFQLQR